MHPILHVASLFLANLRPSNLYLPYYQSIFQDYKFKGFMSSWEFCLLCSMKQNILHYLAPVYLFRHVTAHTNHIHTVIFSLLFMMTFQRAFQVWLSLKSVFFYLHHDVSHALFHKCTLSTHFLRAWMKSKRIFWAFYKIIADISKCNRNLGE
jgi:hypothetical protein